MSLGFGRGLERRGFGVCSLSFFLFFCLSLVAHRSEKNNVEKKKTSKTASNRESPPFSFLHRRSLRARGESRAWGLEGGCGRKEQGGERARWRAVGKKQQSDKRGFFWRASNETAPLNLLSLFFLSLSLSSLKTKL